MALERRRLLVGKVLGSSLYFRRQLAEMIRREEIMNLHEINEAKRRQKKRKFLT